VFATLCINDVCTGGEDENEKGLVKCDMVVHMVHTHTYIQTHTHNVY